MFDWILAKIISNSLQIRTFFCTFCILSVWLNIFAQIFYVFHIFHIVTSNLQIFLNPKHHFNHFISVAEDNFQNYGRLPDFIPHSGVVSMDNPEYILQESKRRGGQGSGNYHTLGIPVIPSPTSSNGPSSLPAPPYTSLSSTNSSSYTPAPSTGATSNYTSSVATAHAPGGSNLPQTGLNGAIFNTAGRAGSNGSHPRSSDGESDHEYYNDVDRLKREMQPLQQQPPRNETTV